MASDTPSRGIPEQIRPLWQSLAARGVSESALAASEEYLAGGSPMTERQMEACLKVMSRFPKAPNASYTRLANHLMDSLHLRYSKADEPEKEKIFWVAYSLFLAQHEENLKFKFDTIMHDVGDNYQDGVGKALYAGIKNTLEKHNPEKGSALALMYTACRNELINVRRHVFSMSHDEVYRNDALNVTRPVSLNTGGENGESLEIQIPSPAMGPLEYLLAAEEEVRLKRLATLTPNDLKLGRNEARVLPYLMLGAQGEEKPRDREIAEELRLSLGDVKTYLFHVRRKIRDYYDGQPSEPKPPSMFSEVLKTSKLLLQPVSNFLTDNQKIVLKACFRLQEEGKPITAASVSLEVFGVDDVKHRTSISEAVKKIIAKGNKSEQEASTKLASFAKRHEQRSASSDHGRGK
jgi:hypothetical protein